jgi:hypothetical protein
MTDLQLYFAIGVPIVMSGFMLMLGFKEVLSAATRCLSATYTRMETSRI